MDIQPSPAADSTSQSSGRMRSRKCVKPCSIGASSRAERSASSGIFSGKQSNPPQMPGEGRRSSRTFSPFVATNHFARFSGNGPLRRAAGSSATRSVLRATQSILTGHSRHRGLRVHTVAPRSMSACV
jgi:hypothetical protein